MGIGRHCFVLLVGALPIGLSSGAYAIEFKQVLTDKSTLSFNYKQMNVPLEGKFRQFEARIAFDPAKLNVAQAQLKIILASIDAGSSEANKALVGKPWFNAETYPSAQFVSTSVKALLDFCERSIYIILNPIFRDVGDVGSCLVHQLGRPR